MSQLASRNHIKLLSTELANQIAAGEVIERPASVLKELIENALDADASRIDVELQNGGMDSIVVIDNGVGIHADELELAISRHATSKIGSSHDLLNLSSLGFRGEALASICSVSQWELISREQDQSIAYKLSYEFPDETLPANHAPGTRLSIRRLFCNTPARKKFLKAERTELRHCDEVIKRLALANFRVGFYVRHNDRQTLRLPAVQDDVGRTRRVSQICGEAFIRQSINLEYPYDGMRLWGWISEPSFSRQSTDLQYFYINGRIIRDRVITHAIRSVYQPLLPAGRHAAYVLHLEMAPADVDVNVHPTKHEVRFRESRLVHDFISRSIRDALKQVAMPLANYEPISSGLPAMPAVNEIGANYSTHDNARTQNDYFGELRDVYFSRYAVTSNQSVLFLIDLPLAVAISTVKQWHDAMRDNTLQSLPLLIPETLDLKRGPTQPVKLQLEKLSDLGFDITLLNEQRAIVRKIPVYLRCYAVTDLITQLLESELDTEDLSDMLIAVLAQSEPDLAKLSLTGLLQTMSSAPEEFKSAWREITAADLADFF